MNLSGIPIGNFLNYYKIPIKNLLVVHDDIDLSLGKVKIKIGGGNGGHNGLHSVDKMIGKMYYRLRIGIGRPKSKDLVNKYVLKKFKKDEKKIIETILDFSLDSIDLLLENKELFLTKIYTFIQKI
jgi:Peptidyl-tRNA hydrolase